MAKPRLQSKEIVNILFSALIIGEKLDEVMKENGLNLSKTDEDTLTEYLKHITNLETRIEQERVKLNQAASVRFESTPSDHPRVKKLENLIGNMENVMQQKENACSTLQSYFKQELDRRHGISSATSFYSQHLFSRDPDIAKTVSFLAINKDFFVTLLAEVAHPHTIAIYLEKKKLAGLFDDLSSILKNRPLLSEFKTAIDEIDKNPNKIATLLKDRPNLLKVLIRYEPQADIIAEWKPPIKHYTELDKRNAVK